MIDQLRRIAGQSTDPITAPGGVARSMAGREAAAMDGKGGGVLPVESLVGKFVIELGRFAFLQFDPITHGLLSRAH
jgi:hypothetical protein